MTEHAIFFLAPFALFRLICRNGREEIDFFVAFTFVLCNASANVRLYQYSSVCYNMIFIVALPINRRRETLRRLSSQTATCNVYKVSLLFYFSSCNIVVHVDDPGLIRLQSGSTPLPRSCRRSPVSSRRLWFDTKSARRFLEDAAAAGVTSCALNCVLQLLRYPASLSFAAAAAAMKDWLSYLM